MNALVITGVGVTRPRPAAEPDHTADGGWPLPSGPAYQVAGTETAALDRRTVRFNHRSTLLAMTACDAAIRDAALAVTDGTRDRIGITVGTTAGSITGTVVFGMDTFTQTRPYLVDASRFPNSVINNTAGALAIRAGLRGANATVAAGPLAGVAALRQAWTSLRCGHVDTMVAGAAEEVTGPAAWWARSHRDTGPQGEGAAMFVLERPEVAGDAGRPVLAMLAAVVVRAVDPADPGRVGAVLTGALATAGAAADEVGVAAVRRTGVAAVDDAVAGAIHGLGGAIEVRRSEDRTGDCFSAHAALQVADIVQEWRSGGGADAALVIAADPAGALAVAVLRRPVVAASSEVGSAKVGEGS